MTECQQNCHTHLLLQAALVRQVLRHPSLPALTILPQVMSLHHFICMVNKTTYICEIDKHIVILLVAFLTIWFGIWLIASDMACLSSWMVWGFSAYTIPFKEPQSQKSSGVKSRLLAGHGIGPPCPIHLSSKVLFSQSETSWK